MEKKPKLQVEDGLFGTSGGIGFTKENELFVGRVAMLGFAVSIISLILNFYSFKIANDTDILSENYQVSIL